MISWKVAAVIRYCNRISAVFCKW